MSPTLVGELHDGRPNRTAVNATIVLPISTTPETEETTTESTKSSSLEADTVRSAQTQSEVRPGNNNFPFNFDDSNYRYNYPGVNAQGLLGRPDSYPSGPFAANPAGPGGYYNSDFYRGFAGQASPEGVNSQRGEAVGGVSPVETLSDGPAGRSPESLDPSAPSPERFRNFDRFPFNNQFFGGGGGGGNFPNPSFLSQRQEGRFGGQSLTDSFIPNFRTNPSLGNNPNYQNLVQGNYPRNLFQPLGDSFQPRQQAFRSNNFDFPSSQRFQNNLFDNFPRSLQRGPNFPHFHPIPFVTDLRDTENLVPSSPSTGLPKKIEETSSSQISPKSDLLKDDPVANSTISATAAKAPEILSVQGQIRFGRILLPTLDDYDDVRFRPDDFREYLFTANNKTKNETATTTTQATANDI